MDIVTCFFVGIGVVAFWAVIIFVLAWGVEGNLIRAISESNSLLAPIASFLLPFSIIGILPEVTSIEGVWAFLAGYLLSSMVSWFLSYRMRK